ncbi:MAG: FMN-dependent NADH-azoreductase [Sphingobacteriales bacterium 41-5]|nr:MAG: FMN-dependent NADH-azoreductase [Sphingobacteriales bacterium 41-5]
MTKLLYIISSPRGAASFSTKLGNAIIEKLKIDQPDIVINKHNLSTNPYPHLEEPHITSFFTPKEMRSPEQHQLIQRSSDAVKDIQETDIVVIATPMHNYFVTSGLKTYFDSIVRAGLTFRQTEKGTEGLLTNKKVYVALASGGIYSSGHTQSNDFATPYIKLLFTTMGINDVTVFYVEGTEIPGVTETALEKAIEKISV